MTFIHFLTGKSSGILSGISSDILFRILSGIFSSICSGTSSGILSGKSSGTLSGISSGILSDISSGILSRILSGISSGIYSDIFWHIFWHSIWHIFWLKVGPCHDDYDAYPPFPKKTFNVATARNGWHWWRGGNSRNASGIGVGCISVGISFLGTNCTGWGGKWNEHVGTTNDSVERERDGTFGQCRAFPEGPWHQNCKVGTRDHVQL